MRQVSGARVEYVNLVVITTRYPKLFSVSGDVSHVRTAAARNGPVADHPVCRGIENTDGSGTVVTTGSGVPSAVRHVQLGPVATGIDPVRAHAGVGAHGIYPSR